MSHPKENRPGPGCLLVKQFLDKGYRCMELRDRESTILYLTPEKGYDNRSHLRPPSQR